MTSPAKLYAKLLDNPGAIISFRDFERLIVAFGYRHVRTKGSHRHYEHPKVAEILTVQPRGKDAHPYQVRAFFVILADYGLRLEP